MKISKKLLSDVADIIAGQSPPSNYYNKNEEGLPFYQGKADFGDKFPIVRSWCTSEKHKEAKTNDILLSVRAPVGPVNICQKNSIIGRGLSAIRAKKGISFEYLYYYLKNNELSISKLGTGSTFKAITQSHIKKITIPIPENYDDQVLIAGILSQAERLIEKRKESIRLLDEFLKSTFLEMFGDPVRNEKGWELKKLPQLISESKNSLKRGPFGGALKKEIFVEEGYLVYEQNHALNNDYSFKRYFIDQKTFNRLKDFEVQAGDILISCSGVYLGKLSIVPEGALPGIINQALLKVSLNDQRMNQVFFVYVFSNQTFKKKYLTSNRGSGIPNLPPMPVIKKIDFISPPIELQKQFVSIVEEVETIKAKYQVSLEELERFYGSLSQRAFKGELDLSRVVVK